MDILDAKIESIYRQEEEEARKILRSESNERLLERARKHDHDGLPVGGGGVAVSQEISHRLQWHKLSDEEIENAELDPSGYKPREPRY